LTGGSSSGGEGSTTFKAGCAAITVPP
jgi:hypothetical protein